MCSVQLFLPVFAAALAVSTVTGQNFRCGITPIPPLESNLKEPWLDHAFHRIVGGVAALPGSWPWQIQVMHGNTHRCGGVIINERWVLSVAHCFSDQKPSSYILKAGSHSKSSADNTEQRRGLTKVIIHPSYDQASINQDIALLQVDNAFEWTDHVRPVCLPREGDDDVAPGTESFITGWGSTMGTGNGNVLKQAMVPIVAQDTCRNAYGSRLTSYMICAGHTSGGGHDACMGDSGGPLVAKDPPSGRWVLHGISSWGQSCALATHPGVYTRVSKYINWIENTQSKSD